ncbi:hypothetical protein POM88_052211 [Heracleum sosnowskyi]|uniref:CSD1 domain-containing protein n=1 Tax=Heracleum sosnowskyi TaxID=360622 RepID=A0AAD8GTM0_9APIA|nr:hypothetical protein POM88_052211 [Heracleum sosnowskyi]
MNRAFDGDIVAVELLPQEQWQEEKSLLLADEDVFNLLMSKNSGQRRKEDDCDRLSNGITREFKQVKERARDVDPGWIRVDGLGRGSNRAVTIIAKAVIIITRF